MCFSWYSPCVVNAELDGASVKWVAGQFVWKLAVLLTLVCAAHRLCVSLICLGIPSRLDSGLMPLLVHKSI